ncbi:hypothetical protein [Pseudolactococcus insecticola]|uniref:Uncharacterized protein n=1 Tax=Pseudolactococcus insecticola TaxID=2709158 RepID=A0A6A0B834_9LACT|nr:hypothetical protein [Lactococcus insecticola]GFH40628.1 hypothetical protein Hs20B_10260 [Lactococcus insecticola]
MADESQAHTSKMRKILSFIPTALSSTVSLYIYLFLFIYLVIFGGLGLLSQLKFLAPSANAQLILGNYTNVLSALGASIAAGTSASIHARQKKHQNELMQEIAKLHAKIDGLKVKARVDGD